jgi:ligand-binding sensor domain-containing protein
MHYKIFFLTLFASGTLWGQTDFSDQWEDFYSYNNVKDFTIDDSQLIALTDNAVFVLDELSGDTRKISSVNGLSGEYTSALYYDENHNRIVIGYENGLVEIIDEDGSITTKPDVLNFSILGSKRINHIAADANNLFLSTPFGIVVFDIATLEFKDTYFIGNASTEIYVNEIGIFNNKIYAATDNGIYIASLDEPYLIDFNNWSQHFTGNYSNIEIFNNQIFVSRNSDLFRLDNDTNLTYINTQPQNIVDIRADVNLLSISTINNIRIYNQALSLNYQTTGTTNPDYDYNINTAYTFRGNLFTGTKAYGVLKSSLSDLAVFEEIHPEGPSSNQVFSISVANDNLWVVYGGYNPAYTPFSIRKGASHYNGEHWIEIPFDNNNSEAITETNLVHVNIDPNEENKVYISSWGDGMVVVENDIVSTHWNHQNSGLESLVLAGNPNYVSIRIGSSTIDTEGNLWVANAWVANRLKKYNGGSWSSYDLSPIITNNVALGLNEVIIDKSGNKWIGTRRNGALVVNKNGSLMAALTTEPSKGDIPDPNVKAIAVDKNNKVWIGTRAGLVVFNSSSTFFTNEVYTANPVVIDYGQDDNYGEALLGNQNINTICVDGADNKWFGTDSGGVLYTNPSGKETLLQLDKNNSPLPSNRILKIRFDASTGKVFFATDKGILAYNSNVAPFGKHLEEVYAYPNPALKQHDFITIDGRNGTHLPNGTNVKILDAAGKLVYETNVKEGQERYGGKVVWDKTNLAGHKVASGVYIVLLTIEDTSETSMTKIAIIN